MDAERLLTKLEFEADRASEKKWNEQRLETIRRCQRKKETKAEQSRKTLHQLRARTAEIEEELRLRSQVEREQERFCKAERALREKNRTLAERKVYDAEIRRGQILFSRVVAEAHPDWREQENPNAEIYRQQYTPTHCSKLKNR